MKINCAYTELVDLHKLVQHPKNANKHSDQQIELLKKLIDFQGFRHPIIVSKLSGFIVAGHARLQVALKLGYSQVPVDYQDFENDAQEYAFLVSDNTIQELSETDLSLVNLHSMDLGPDFDLELLGIPDFVVEPLDKLDPQTDEDSVPEKVPTKSVLGDVYEIGNHRLMCGDSTFIDSVDTLMNGQKADMVFTDPPYGMNAVSKEGKVGGGTKHAPAKIYRPVIGDEDTTVARSACEMLLGLSIPKYFIWGGNYFSDFLPPSPCWIVWDKQRPEGLTFADGEVAWTNLTTPLKFLRHRWDGYHKASEKGQERVHPTQKPAYLAEWVFKEYGTENDSILDVFGGSGSTLIACEKTNRKCFMMELDPHYCDVIVTRWCKYTGINKIKRNGEEIIWETN